MKFLKKIKPPDQRNKEHPSTTQKKAKALLEEKEISTYFIPERSAPKQDGRHHRNQTQPSSKSRADRRDRSEPSPTRQAQERVTQSVEVPNPIGQRSISLPQRSSSRISWPNSAQIQIKTGISVINGRKNVDRISRKVSDVAQTTISIGSKEKDDQRHVQVLFEATKDSTEILPDRSGDRKFGQASLSYESAQHVDREPQDSKDCGLADRSFGQHSKLNRLKTIQASPRAILRTPPSGRQWKLQQPISRSHQSNHQRPDRQRNEKSDTDSSSMARLLWQCNKVQTQAEDAESLRLQRPVIPSAEVDPALGSAGRPDFYPRNHPQGVPLTVDQLPEYMWRDVGMYDSETMPAGVSGYGEFDQEPASEVPFFPDGAYNNVSYEPDTYTYEYDEVDYLNGAFHPHETLPDNRLEPGNHSTEYPVSSHLAPTSTGATRDRMAGFWRPNRLY